MDKQESLYAAGFALAAFFALLAFLVWALDDLLPTAAPSIVYFAVAVILIAMLVMLFLFIDWAWQGLTGEGVVEFARRRRSVPKQYRGRR